MIGILRTVGIPLTKTDRQHSDTMLLTRSRKTIPLSGGWERCQTLWQTV